MIKSFTLVVIPVFPSTSFAGTDTKLSLHEMTENQRIWLSLQIDWDEMG